jgi:hypothetical protein
MSSPNPEFELDLDLQFLPAWAKQPDAAKRFANHPGDEGGPRGEQGERPFRRGPRDDRARGPRPGGPRREGGGGPPGQRGPRPPFRDHRGGPHGGRGDRPEGGFVERPPLPAGIDVALLPDDAGMDLLVKQIRHTGRAYPLVDVAHLILKRPERYHLEFRCVAREGAEAPKLYVCNLDDSVWLAEGDVVRHVLGKFFETFYKPEKTPTERPRGTYTFVAQCGLSGVILGPPNHHDYPNALRRLHAERFARMPFDAFKSRVKIVRDEAVVAQWIEEQSFRTEYECLNLPEPLKLDSREAVARHFREVHLPNVVRTVDRFAVTTPAAREALPGPLKALARREVEGQQRFPIKLITWLSERFTRMGLQLFKVNKTALHVCAARPRHLDLETSPVSDNIRRLVEAIAAQPGLNRRALFEKLGIALPPQPAPGEAPPAEAAAPSPELAALIGDLHWLVHQGHVIEFADGRLETAKKPLPKPPPPPRKERPPRPAAAVASSEPAPTQPAAEDAPAAPTDAASAPEPAAETPPESAGTPSEPAPQPQENEAVPSPS